MLNISYISDSDERIEHVYQLVNAVFKVFEAKLWDERYERVSLETLQSYAKKRELIIGEYEGLLVTAVHLERIDKFSFRFGMLVTNNEYQGKGIANQMRLFVEKEAKSKGAANMLLEILKPEYETHTEKDKIQQWYQRYDYSLSEIQAFSEWYPHLAKIIKIPSELYILSKLL
jgi:hypothetical protein